MPPTHQTANDGGNLGLGRTAIAILRQHRHKTQDVYVGLHQDTVHHPKCMLAALLAARVSAKRRPPTLWRAVGVERMPQSHIT